MPLDGRNNRGERKPDTSARHCRRHGREDRNRGRQRLGGQRQFRRRYRGFRKRVGHHWNFHGRVQDLLRGLVGPDWQHEKWGERVQAAPPDQVHSVGEYRFAGPQRYLARCPIDLFIPAIRNISGEVFLQFQLPQIGEVDFRIIRLNGPILHGTLGFVQVLHAAWHDGEGVNLAGDLFHDRAGLVSYGGLTGR
jgi:hypothetical protein